MSPSPPSASGREPVQEYTLAEAEGNDRVLPFVQYDPRSAPEAALRFAAAIDAGARGLKKLHPCSHQIPANDRSLYPLFAVAEARRIPLMVHVGSSVFPGAKMRYCDPLLVDEVAVDFPDLQVLCAHSGRGFWTQQVFGADPDAAQRVDGALRAPGAADRDALPGTGAGAGPGAVRQRLALLAGHLLSRCSVPRAALHRRAHRECPLAQRRPALRLTFPTDTGSDRGE